MANDKKEYTAAIEAMLYAGTPAAGLNKINKIIINTEDAKLAALLKATIPAVGHGPASFVLYANPVIKYCEAVLATQEPQWQILAKRNGWRPPAAT